MNEEQQNLLPNGKPYSTLTVNILDSPTGAGKTTAMLDQITLQDYGRLTDTDRRFIYVTPLLTENDRAMEYFSAKGFEVCCPNGEGESKNSQAYYALKEGRNIVCTHALLYHFNNKILSLLKEGRYKYDLIMDEEPILLSVLSSETAEQLEGLPAYNKADIEAAEREGLLTIDEATERLIWNYNHCYNDGASGAFTVIKNWCELYDLYLINKRKGIVGVLRRELFEAFNNIWIMSYRTKYNWLGSYLSLYRITPRFYHIDTYDKRRPIRNGYELEHPRDSMNLIYNYSSNNLLCSTKDERHRVLTYTWSKTFALNHWREKLTKEQKQDIAAINANLMAFLKDIDKAEASRILWTCFKPMKQYFKDQYPGLLIDDNYLAPNTKATNQYQDRDIVIYLCARGLNPNMKNFQKKFSLRHSQDSEALSEVIQFIFRSSLRRGEQYYDETKGREVDNVPTNVFIADRRTCSNFQQWVNEAYQGIDEEKDELRRSSL